MPFFRQFGKVLTAGLILLVVFFFGTGWCGVDQQVMQVMQTPHIQWLGNGSIFVQPWHSGKGWLLNPVDQAYTPLPYSLKYKQKDFSFTGQKIVVHGFRNFWFGPAKGPLSEPIKIPVWVRLEPSEDEDKYFLINVQTRISWVSDQILLVNQRNRDTGEVRCSLFDTQTGSWDPIKDHCISSPGLFMGAIIPAGRGIAAVSGFDEGTQVLEFVKQIPKKGYAPLDFPFINLYGGGINVHFFVNLREIYLTTPCDLDKINLQNQVFPCEGVSSESSKWRLYSWLPESNKPLQLLRSGLPKHVVFNPMDNSQTAWPGPGVVCLGDLNKTGGITCIPLPKIKNVKENAWN